MKEDAFRDHLERPYRRGVPLSKTHSASALNPVCGDEVTLHLVIVDGIISEAWHQVAGCMLCSASASILCEHIENHRVSEAVAISDSDMISLIGIKPSPGRIHCCTLPLVALAAVLQSLTSSLLVAAPEIDTHLDISK